MKPLHVLLALLLFSVPGCLDLLGVVFTKKFWGGSQWPDNRNPKWCANPREREFTNQPSANRPGTTENTNAECQESLTKNLLDVEKRVQRLLRNSGKQNTSKHFIPRTKSSFMYCNHSGTAIKIDNIDYGNTTHKFLLEGSERFELPVTPISTHKTYQIEVGKKKLSHAIRVVLEADFE